MQYALNPNQDCVDFLFNIAHVIKLSYTSPVILMTRQDYANSIFNFLIDMRAALLEDDSSRIVEIITKFHIEWLEAVNEVLELKVKVKNMPRDVVFKAISFTMECGDFRCKQFQKLIDQSIIIVMTPTELDTLKKDIGSIKDLGQSLNAILHEKQNTLQSFAYNQDFYNHVEYELEELLNWLDCLYDNLVFEFSKIMGMEYPEFLSDLTKTLQEIVNEISQSTDTEAQKCLKLNPQRNMNVGVRLAVDETEIGEIMNKILVLNKRLERLKNEESIAVMALQHKKLYLEERLRSLENIKKTISIIKGYSEYSEADDQNDKRKPNDSRIFDHHLPEDDRMHLVEEFMKLWTNALGIIQPEVHSIISILSVSCLKETFKDDAGKFSVDKHGRKIYKRNNDDSHLYQLNEKNELVPVNDDIKHVYFYDDCGRYYKNYYNQRIYKAHPNASEYLLNEGLMVKVKETREGHVFYYDHLGRYYENEDGKKIYWEEGSVDRYENDGIGNLIRIHDGEINYTYCSQMGGFTEESKYVHEAVGSALKECIKAVIAVLPDDPILYLASCLDKYRANIIEGQKRKKEEQDMAAERERMRTASADKLAVMLCNSFSSGEEEYSSSNDDNIFVNCEPLQFVEK